ncbi:hypothetical protein [Stigmatella aurantiaca]|uniref:Conserved uncharacterized protein n=1 Tax=Stigmatella aurantiaca (strain DW4/3-1) TaxID=378806 RepID=Q08QV4_STIAD|nr:hypothetical protein [Stigmatella aurantiaca]ADO70006.1 conserved uncharacterized protein [Stigmatella aurantiaca DW4/3-1]EAU62867.1 hypothetical protein STIAU_2138 [Stigmatella aurantiaca DW4/3-1]
MERKVGSSTVTTKEVKTALEKARTLTSEEEKVLRMRHGAGAPSPRAPLPRAAGNNEELADELLVIEMQLMKAMRARTGQVKTGSKSTVKAAAPAKEPAKNAAKEKIVRALRKKK